MKDIRGAQQFGNNNSIPPRQRLPTDITGSSTNQNFSQSQAPGTKYEMYKNSTKKLQQKQRTNNYMAYNIDQRNDMQTAAS